MEGDLPPSCPTVGTVKPRLPSQFNVLTPEWQRATTLRRYHLSFVSSLRRTRLERVSTLPHHVSFSSAGSSAPLLAAQRQVALSFLLLEIGWLTPIGQPRLKVAAK